MNELGWWLCECPGWYAEATYVDDDGDPHRAYYLVRPEDGGHRKHAPDASTCHDCKGGTMRHTENLRKPTLQERLYFKLFGLWPDSYVDARMGALALDEMEARMALRKELLAERE